ncbi:MAG: DNA-3-methyladenine glycosylase I [Dehalococcoidia bacterium]
MAALDEATRCAWAGGNDPLMTAYHDEEWGVPLHDDRALFELLTLEGAQAGLSWQTVLRRRDSYRRAFEGFDAERIAAYGDEDRARLLADAGIIRNRAKVDSTIGNARALLDLLPEHGTFDAYLWGFVGGAPRQNRFASLAELPAETEQSRALSRDLRTRGFRFVGPTICYAFMQAAGFVNDHEVSCFRYAELATR